jgi:hypothetical protein
MSDLKNFDDEDVKAVLARVTSDGPGTDNFASLPESDFVSFSTENVEKEEEAK